MKTKVLFFLSALLAGTSLMAQNLAVKQFGSSTDVVQMADKRHSNDLECAVVKINYSTLIKSGRVPKIAVNDMYLVETALHADRNELWAYFAPGAVKCNIVVDGYNALRVRFDKHNIEELAEAATYRLVLAEAARDPYYKPSQGFFVGASYELGVMPGVGVHLGCTYKHLELELGYRIGTTKSGIVNWYTNSTENSELDTRTEYKLNSLSLKLGYVINLHYSVALVPRLGYALHTLSANNLEGENTFGDGSKLANMSIGVKAVYSPIKHVSLFVAPEYDIPMGKSDLYNTISTAGNFTAGGFYCPVGLLFHF